MAPRLLENFVKKRFVVLTTNIKCRKKHRGETEPEENAKKKNLCKIFDVIKNVVKELELYIKRNNIW